MVARHEINPANRLLVSRKRAMRILDVAYTTLRVWEKKGVLRALKPSGTDASGVYYAYKDLEALVDRLAAGESVATKKDSAA